VDKTRYDAVMGLTLRSLTRGHRVLHRVTRGRLGRHFPGGQQIVWITTLGRRSGQWRSNPLLAVRDGTSGSGVEGAAVWVVAGSNAGQAKVPGWVFNVRAHPLGWLQVGEQRWECRVDEVTGDDRDRLYRALEQEWKSFATYQRMAGRYIPVFRVVPLAAADAHTVPPTHNTG